MARARLCRQSSTLHCHKQVLLPVRAREHTSDVGCINALSPWWCGGGGGTVNRDHHLNHNILIVLLCRQERLWTLLSCPSVDSNRACHSSLKEPITRLHLVAQVAEMLRIYPLLSVPAPIILYCTTTT